MNVIIAAMVEHDLEEHRANGICSGEERQGIVYDGK